MNNNLVMEIPEIKDLVDTFVSVMRRYTNKGIIKIGNYKMESSAYTAGDGGSAFWEHKVIYIRRIWSSKQRGIIIWWWNEFGSYHIKTRFKYIKRHYDEIAKVIDQIPETYRAIEEIKKTSDLRRIEQQRQNIKQLWEKD